VQSEEQAEDVENMLGAYNEIVERISEQMAYLHAQHQDAWSELCEQARSVDLTDFIKNEL